MMRAASRLAVLLLVAVTAGAAPQVSLSDIEDEVMCPVCGTPLSLSESPLAERQRTYIQRLIDEGRTKDEIKTGLAREFGDEVLAMPERTGFSLTAYLVPAAGLALAAGALSIAAVRRRRTISDTMVPEEPRNRFEDLVDEDLARLP